MLGGPLTPRSTAGFRTKWRGERAVTITSATLPMRPASSTRSWPTIRSTRHSVVAAAYDFSKANLIADIGGGNGETLRWILALSADHISSGQFRHGSRLIRWRTDKAPEDCRMDQIHC